MDNLALMLILEGVGAIFVVFGFVTGLYNLVFIEKVNLMDRAKILTLFFLPGLCVLFGIALILGGIALNLTEIALNLYKITLLLERCAE